jgi:hypothetical protein
MELVIPLLMRIHQAGTMSAARKDNQGIGDKLQDSLLLHRTDECTPSGCKFRY